jgi:xanthine dehydrogenase YagR molybdenum-binding subunit
MEDRRVMGKSYNRLDGPAKASGRAKYSQDILLPGMLYGAVLHCPHAHAKVTSIDIGPAEKMPGVKAAHVTSPVGTEIQWAGTEVAAVAAETEEQARDAVRAIKVEYEVMSHLVNEDDLAKAQAANRAKPDGEVVSGDPDLAFKQADVVSEADYGIPVLTHCCHETHGQVIGWQGDQIDFYPSTQSLPSIGGDLAKALEVPATNVRVRQQYMGGGFGSKFASDVWGQEAARLSKAASGAHVKMHLDRGEDLVIAGCRPSFYGHFKLGAQKDGTITAWESSTWATGGVGGGGLSASLAPYVFTKIPNKRINHTRVETNNGPSRAWRAPNHPQLSFLTCSAITDLAFKLKMDPMQVFLKNFQHTDRPEVYTSQLLKAAEIIDWRRYYTDPGYGAGPVKRGLGIGVGTWSGIGHNATARVTIYPDGTVELEQATQDLGTGTRTIMGQVAAETLGLELRDIRVKIGDNNYPLGGTSGGSTTVGGAGASTRRASVNAREKLFEEVAPSLGVTADQLEAVGGRVQVKGDSSRSMSWIEACRKLDVTPAEATGENDRRNPGGLIDGGVGGVQIADVSVDIETGVVSMNRLAIVQDCGLIINPKTATCQCYGASIMAICGALYEERVMDEQTGRMLNDDMEFYKLAGIKDIGEIIVHLDIRPEHDKRGVIGLGEPPTVPGMGAIANAVANAIGVRVPRVPLTPQRVLAALEGRRA